jgi:hypothetical protein
MFTLYSVSEKMPAALLFLVIQFLPCHTLADTAAAAKPETQANLNEAAHASPSERPSERHQVANGTLGRLAPHLEQALIIFTSANVFVIVFGVILVFLKERLHSQTSHTLAALKVPQRIAPDSASEIKNNNAV